LFGEADLEPLIVEGDDVGQGERRPVVKIRRTRRQTTQDRPFELADVGALARDHGAAEVGDGKRRSFQWPAVARHSENREPVDVQDWRGAGALDGIKPSEAGDPDIDRELKRVITDIRRVMACATEA